MVKTTAALSIAAALVIAPYVVAYITSGDDGGAGAISPPSAKPDSAPGMDETSVAEVSLLAVAAKHMSEPLGRVPQSPDHPRERMRVMRWTHYWRAYEELLRPIRHKPGAVFVEVGAFGGGSAQVWAEWLGPEVDVHIIDINDVSSMMKGVRVTTWQGDQANVSFWRDTFFPAVGQIDALVDDGGHTSEQQTVTLREALPWVKPGGVLAIEDTHSSFFADQLCASLPETASVVHDVRSAYLRNQTPRTVESFWGGPSPRLLPGGGDADLQAALGRLMLHADALDQCLVKSEALQPWSFMEEAKTLVTDLHAWWFDSEEPCPGFLHEKGREELFDTQSRHIGLAQHLRDARTVRGSLLGRDWRRWFVRHVASVRFYESIVVVQRWWDRAGRGKPAATITGSADARIDTGLDGPHEWHLLQHKPVGQRQIVLNDMQWEIVGPHMRRLVERVEARELRRGDRA